LAERKNDSPIRARISEKQPVNWPKNGNIDFSGLRIISSPEPLLNPAKTPLHQQHQNTTTKKKTLKENEALDHRCSVPCRMRIC